MTHVRPPAVAGSFYPSDADTLRTTVVELLAAEHPPSVGIQPRILIVPHAGYVYSGSTAAAAYRLLHGSPDRDQRIGIIGPAHFVPLSGIATAGADAFATPLGIVAVDQEMTASVTAHPEVSTDPAAHGREHSLEVQLPFLQVTLATVTVLPLLIGQASPDTVADVLETVVDSADLVVVSSDLSHYLEYEAARRRDEATAAAIVALEPERLAFDDACGRTAVQGALVLGRRRGWSCRRLALRNSGDTAGPRQRVVGYGAFAVGPED